MPTRTFSLLVLAVVLGTPASHATSDSEIAIGKCAAIQQPAKRLACYDGIAKSLATPAQLGGKRGSGFGNWVHSERRDPLDDTLLITASLKSIEGTMPNGDPVTLVLRCKKGDIEAITTWGVFLGRKPKIITRYGKQEKTEDNWVPSADGTAAFHLVGQVFLREMSKVNRLVLRAFPFRDNPMTAVFDLAGLSAVKGALKKGCRLWYEK